MVSASFVSTAAGAATVTSSHGQLIPAHQGQILPKKNADTSSLNWSGYATTGSGITGVKSTFTVPSVNPLPPGFAANWAGIGGYSTSDLIQAGTSEDAVQGNYAWYEILPASETIIDSGCTGDPTCTVNTGDVVTVDIHKVGTDLWSVALTDAGHWSWQKNITYASTESSAEWIFEAPTLVVQTIPANTGVNHFGPTSTFTDGAGTHTIAQGNPVSISMGAGLLVNEATPSALASDGQSFNVCAYAQTCAAP